MMRQLLKRRVPQIVGAYLATSWILLEFTDWAVGQYALSPALTNFVVTTLLLLLPAVAVLAWRHGAPGEDPWTKTDVQSSRMSPAECLYTTSPLGASYPLSPSIRQVDTSQRALEGRSRYGILRQRQMLPTGSWSLPHL